MYIQEDGETYKKKKLMEKLTNESINALDKISNKLDVRTVAAYRKKIYASNRVDTLEKYIKTFNSIFLVF